jgi:UDP-N-acetylmuramoylalanine--D-glutamate ligase
MGDLPENVGDRIHAWSDLDALRERQVHVVGAGSVEGAHLLLFLLDRGFTRLIGHDFAEPAAFERAFKRVHVGWSMDEREEMLARLRGGVELRLRDRYLDGIESAAVIAVTQGWYLYPANAPLLRSEELQRRFLSLVQLYLALAPGRVVGVSGSNGKSTTTRLLGEVLSSAGMNVAMAGNDRHGQQVLGRLEHLPPSSLLVLEVSNRHLKMLRRSPQVAVLTNVFPNHLDEHGGWEGYVAAKTTLVAHQKAGDIAVLNADLEVTRAMRSRTPARTLWFGEGVGGGATPAGVRVEGERLIAVGMPLAWSLPRADLLLPGEHNAANVAAAATAALALGAPAEAVTTAARGFRGLKHRIQFVWEKDGVRWYDDLNSTTPTASAAALRTLGAGVVWILGGDDKGLDPAVAADAARDAARLALALPGPGTDRVVTALRRAGVAVEPSPDLAAAVRRAIEVATPGDKVLLSPACPGFFTRHYVGADEDTGFKRVVRELTLSTSPPARRPRRSAGQG